MNIKNLLSRHTTLKRRHLDVAVTTSKRQKKLTTTRFVSARLEFY